MFKKFFVALWFMAASGLANAGVIIVGASVDVKSTNYTEIVSIAKFDDMAGTRILESVGVSITGLVEGNVGIENLDAKPSNIIARIGAELELVGPLGRLLSSTVPTVARTFNASAYDGTNDYGGTSGRFFNDLGASSYDSVVLTDALTLAFFSGTGLADFDFSAMATSTVAGSGNLITSFSTKAGADIQITYTFSEMNVSEPAVIGTIGILMLAVRRFRST